LPTLQFAGRRREAVSKINPNLVGELAPELSISSAVALIGCGERCCNP
jgi:hypothetical protein